ncbi:hypothetical protein BC342_23795 [Streptomyces olivaceus]|nr:hypothetical protein BC342_23795 [Streptomyces olivaceus]
MHVPLANGGSGRPGPPFVVPRAVAALSRLLEQLEAVQVCSARHQGWSWREIATELGVGRQAVHKKYGRR